MKNEIKSNQVEIAVELQNKLEDELDTRIDISYINLNIETSKKGYSIHIYNNEYDYKILRINFLESKKLEYYINEVLSSLENGEYSIHVANPIEIFLLKLLEQKKISHKFLYIYDGEIHMYDNSLGDSIPISEIKSLCYNPKDLMLEIVNIDDYKYWIDLKNKDVKMLESPHNEDTQVSNYLKLDEQDIINDIFWNWLEDVTEDDLDATIEEIVEGLKEELQMMIDKDCGDRFINGKLLSKLENPSYKAMCFMHKTYMEMRESWIKQREE